MTTAVNIANKALGFLAVKKKISSLETTTGDADATTLAGYYPESKAITLSSLDWSFARKRRVRLEAVDNFMENGRMVWLWAYPGDFLTKPKIYTTDRGGCRYEVSFNSHFSGGRRVVETESDNCTIDYVCDIDERFYFPRLDTLHALKLAELARNEIALGRSSVAVNGLKKRFDDLLGEMGESEYQLKNTLHDTINTYEEARNEGVVSVEGEYYY